MLTAKGEEADIVGGLNMGAGRLHHEALQPKRAAGPSPRGAPQYGVCAGREAAPESAEG